MKILLLGGTGAMGKPLAQILAQNNENNIYITSRSRRGDLDNIHYLQGNAKNNDFLKELLNEKFDVIVDFLVYNTEELKERISLVLDNTDQYFFFSSARCFAESNEPITEVSPRLVDVCSDLKYLKTDEYALAKGREENILLEFGQKNWTIIRPYITYNSQRLQLGVFEKEHWLWRALNGGTVVFPKDIAQRKTSLTYGVDVAKTVALLIGNPKAYGESLNIITSETHTWGEILDFYCKVIEDKTGKKVKVCYLENSEELQEQWNPWQIKYDRLFDRAFDSSKVDKIVGKVEYRSTFEGIEQCLTDFIINPRWLKRNWNFEAWCDKQCGEWTPLFSDVDLKSKAVYLKYRLF